MCLGHYSHKALIQYLLKDYESYWQMIHGKNQGSVGEGISKSILN